MPNNFTLIYIVCLVCSGDLDLVLCVLPFSACYGLFTQNLNGTGTGNNIMLKFSHCKGTGTETHKHYMYICTCYCTRKGTCYCTGKGTKWLGKPLVPVLVPLPLQCENFHIIYSEPIVVVPVPVSVPFKFCANISHYSMGNMCRQQHLE